VTEIAKSASDVVQKRKPGRPPIPIEQRFWSRVDKSGECWLWTGRTCKDEYGQIWFDGRTVRAHRLSYQWVHGPIPKGLLIDHKCHVSRCVKPEHLQAVTTKENAENLSGPTARCKSGVRGVAWRRDARKWTGQVKHHGKSYHTGYFSDLAEAEAAVIALRKKLFTNNLKDLQC
jgi:hypothetical protein